MKFVLKATLYFNWSSQVLGALENTFFNWRFDGLSRLGHAEMLYETENGLSISLNALLNTELNSDYFAWLSFSMHPEGRITVLSPL